MASRKNNGSKEFHDGKTVDSRQEDFIGFKLGFDPLKKADLIEAEFHKECKRVRNLSAMNSTIPTRSCECCGLPLVDFTQDAPVFPLCTPVIELSDLGPGFPQYYWFVKYLFLAIAGLPALISDYIANHYEDWDSEPQWAIVSSTGNQGHPNLRSSVLPLWQSILHIIAMILILFSYYWVSAWMIRQEGKIDEMNTTPADYTVWLKGLRPNFNQEKLKEFLTLHGRSDGKPSTVVKLNVPIQITDYIEAARKQHYFRSRLKYLEMHSDQRGQPPSTSCCCCFRKKVPSKNELESSLAKVTQEMQRIESRYEEGKMEHMSTGQVFVTFATQMDAKLVIENFSGNAIIGFLRRLCGLGSFSSYSFEKKHLKGKRAPEPSDIIWENLGTKFVEKIWHRSVTYLVTLLTLCACFGMVYGCTVYRKYIYDYYKSADVKTFTDKSRNRMASILPALGVITINFILARAIRKFSSYEKLLTLTSYNTSVAVKLTIAQCVNTALIAILVSMNWEDWFKPFGLVVDMHYIFISNTVVGALVSLMSPMYLIKLLQRCLRKHSSFLVQGEANALYEGPPVDMAQRYANVVKTLIVVLAYAPIMPLGFLFGMATLLLDYWVDKMLLLRRHSRPMRMSGEMSKAMLNCVPWAVMIYSVGVTQIMNYVFIHNLNDDSSGPALIWMIICIGLVFLPVKVFLHYCCCCFRCFRRSRTNIDMLTKTYDDEAIKFIDDYDRVNPVTQREGWEFYLKLVSDKNMISQDARNELLTKLGRSGFSSMLQNYAGSRMSLRQYQAQYEPSKGNMFLQSSDGVDVISVLRANIAQKQSVQSQYHSYGVPQNAGIGALAYYIAPSKQQGSDMSSKLAIVSESIQSIAQRKKEDDEKKKVWGSKGNLYPDIDA